MTDRLGLVGGLAVNAGIFYYQELVARFQAQHGHVEILLVHANLRAVLSLVSSGDTDGLAAYLSEIVIRLSQAGCGVAAITAIAPHMCIDQLQERSSIPVVDALAAVRGFVGKESRSERVAIFGNSAVVNSNIYGALEEHRVIRPSGRRADQINEVYNSIALLGKRGTEDDYHMLEQWAMESLDCGAQRIVLAGTDLSSFYRDWPPTYPHVDVAQLHIDAIISALACPAR